MKRVASMILIAVGIIGLIYEQPIRCFGYTFSSSILAMGALFYGIYFLSAHNSFVLSKKTVLINVSSILSMYFMAVVLGFCWLRLLIWRMHQPAVFDLSGLFAVLPGNNLSFLSQYSPTWLNAMLRIVYDTGYFTPLLLPVFCNVSACQFKRAWQYFLSGHFLQAFLMTPLYMVFSVKEVWYVTGIPDGLQRVFESGAMQLFMVSWCFPSMHTSVALASFLVARQEPNKLFRYCWCSYCIAVIISTLWFPIHWTLDVVGGLLVGYIAFRLANRIMSGTVSEKITLPLHTDPGDKCCVNPER